MQNLNLCSPLESAKIAAQQENWSLLNYYLQECLGRQESPGSTPSSEPALELQDLLPFALRVLEFGDFQERWDVAKLFPAFGEMAIAPLILYLQNEAADPEVRWFAARIIGDFRQPQVLMVLIDLLRSSTNPDLCDGVATALADFGVEAISALANLVAQESTRLLAVRTLSQIRHSAVIPLLLQVVNDPQAAIRELAIETLSSFHDPRIPPILLAALNDQAALVRKAAVTGLGFRADWLESLPLVKCITPLLFDPQLEVCQQAAIALGRLGTPLALAALTQVLQSSTTPEALQITLVRSLVWTNQPQALTHLQAALGLLPVVIPFEAIRESHQTSYPTIHLSTTVLHALITVLGQVEPPLTLQATELLLALLESNHPALQQPTLRQLLALTLGQLGEAIALPPLQQLLADPDIGVQLHATAALKQFSDF